MDKIQFFLTQNKETTKGHEPNLPTSTRGTGSKQGVRKQRDDSTKVRKRRQEAKEGGNRTRGAAEEGGS